MNIAPTVPNRKFAERLVADIRREIALGIFNYAKHFPDSPRGQVAAAPRRTFEQVARLYLESIGQLEVATIDQYTNAIENVWFPLLGAATAFDALTHEVLAAKIGGHAWASGKTCNNYLIPLRGVFALVYRGPRALENPMAGIENMAVVKKLPDPLTPAERDAILADMRERYDVRVWAYFAFAFFTGMRPEEIIALQWGDIDWRAGQVRVQRVRTFRGSERDGSKTHMERDVDLTDPAIAALQAMKPFTFMKRDEDGEPVDLFENPLTRAAWHDERSQRDTYWKPSLRRLGIRARRAYATRHTAATAALMGGLKPGYVAQQLGHSLQVLLSTYAKWMPEADGGSERDKLRALHSASNSSPVFPQESGARNEAAGKPLNINELPAGVSGRRDWIRTHSAGKK